MQCEAPLLENVDDYVTLLLRTRIADLQDLELRRQQGAILQEEYLSCRRALLGTIDDLRKMQMLVTRRTDELEANRGGEGV